MRITANQKQYKDPDTFIKETFGDAQNFCLNSVDRTF